MAYTPYYPTWHDADSVTGGGDTSTPLVAAALQHIEDGIAAAAATADAAIADVSHVTNGPLYWNGSAWVSDTLKNAQIASDAALAVSKLAAGSSNQILATSASTAQWVTLTSLLSTVLGWGTYNPTWSADSGTPSLGDGTLTGRYVQIGKTVIGTVELQWGSSTSGGTSGNWSFTLPVTARAPLQFLGIGTVIAVDSSPFKVWQGMTRLNSATAVQCDTPVNTIFGKTVPFTWASGDTLGFNFVYEAA